MKVWVALYWSGLGHRYHLGPLFLLYILLTLPIASLTVIFSIYADDLKIFKEVRLVSDCESMAKLDSIALFFMPNLKQQNNFASSYSTNSFLLELVNKYLFHIVFFRTYCSHALAYVLQCDWHNFITDLDLNIFSQFIDIIKWI